MSEDSEGRARARSERAAVREARATYRESIVKQEIWGATECRARVSVRQERRGHRGLVNRKIRNHECRGIFQPLRFGPARRNFLKFLGDATRNHPRERMALRFLAYGSSLPSRNEHGDLAVFVA